MCMPLRAPEGIRQVLRPVVVRSGSQNTADSRGKEMSRSSRDVVVTPLAVTRFPGLARFKDLRIPPGSSP